MRIKLKIWLKRYLPAEIFGIIGALVGGTTINIFFHDATLTALAGTWGENIGYYGTIVFKDLKKQKEIHNKITFSILIKTVRNLFLEFGPGEYFDSLIIRPFAMYLFPKLLHNLALGFVVGKLAADITFYFPTIISYELKNRFFKEENFPV